MTINKAKPKNWYFVSLIILVNLICLIQLTEFLRSALLSFLVQFYW